MAVSSTALLTLDELKTLLGLPTTPSDQDARFEALINACSVAIENLASRYFVIRHDYVEHHEPPPRDQWPNAGGLRKWTKGQTLYLRRYPVVTLTSIEDEAGFVIPVSEVNVRPEIGVLYRSGGWFIPQDTFGTPARWAITYDVGMFNSTTDVTADLKTACAMFVGVQKAQGVVPGGNVDSRTLGKVSVTFESTGMGADALVQGMPDQVVQWLAPYMSRDV